MCVCHMSLAVKDTVLQSGYILVDKKAQQTSDLNSTAIGQYFEEIVYSDKKASSSHTHQLPG